MCGCIPCHKELKMLLGAQEWGYVLGVPSANHILCPLQAVAVRKQEEQLPPARQTLLGVLRGGGLPHSQL